jgi:hypothetical protein
MRFLYSGFIHKSTPFGPCLLYKICFKFWIEFAELFDFKIFILCYGPLRKTKVFAETMDLNLSSVGPH